MKPIIFLSLLSFAVGVFVLSPMPHTFAADNPLGVINPRAGNEAVPPEQTPTSFLDNLYIWLLGFVAIAALFALVYGGVLYIFSGAISSTAEARRWITNAIVGLLIAGLSYLILSTINPDLVKKFDIQTLINNAVGRIPFLPGGGSSGGGTSGSF